MMGALFRVKSEFMKYYGLRDDAQNEAGSHRIWKRYFSYWDATAEFEGEGLYH